MNKKISPSSTDREAMREWFAEQGLEYLEDVRFQTGLEGIILKAALTQISFKKNHRKLEEKKANLAPVKIAWINKETGYGLFADQNLAKGKFVGIYTGIIQESKIGRETTYSYRYPFSKRFEINASLAGNETRFLNHSDPSMISETQLVQNVDGRVVYHDNLWEIAFQTNCPVPRGRELRINYGDTYFKNIKKEHSSFHLEKSGRIKRLDVEDLPELAKRFRYLTAP